MWEFEIVIVLCATVGQDDREKIKECEYFLNRSKGVTNIETNAITKGFLCSAEMSELKYNKLIGK